MMAEHERAFTSTNASGISANLEISREFSTIKVGVRVVPLERIIWSILLNVGNIDGSSQGGFPVSGS